MRIVCCSDTHTKFGEIKIPDGDMIIHAGDACARGYFDEFEIFAKQFGSLPHKHKILIAGNHDWVFERNKEKAEEILQEVGGITYLQDREVQIDGLRIYGSPWSPRFNNWAFNVDRGQKLLDIWRHIPEKVDVLVTHGPAFGTLDVTVNGQHVGCEDLSEELEGRVHPRLHVFGHIHHSYGICEKNKTISVNASCLDARYRYANEPICVDL